MEFNLLTYYFDDSEQAILSIDFVLIDGREMWPDVTVYLLDEKR
jgi:hypothetical protein